MALPNIFKGRLRKIETVERYDGPSPKTGSAYFNIYRYTDGSCKTVEFSHSGKHAAEYEGEPTFPEGAPDPTLLSEGQPPKAVPPPPPPPKAAVAAK